MIVLRHSRNQLHRAVKPLVVVAAAVIGPPLGIGPAQAATASVTISNDVVLPGDGTLTAVGTATCGPNTSLPRTRH